MTGPDFSEFRGEEGEVSCGEDMLQLIELAGGLDFDDYELQEEFEELVCKADVYLFRPHFELALIADEEWGTDDDKIAGWLQEHGKEGHAGFYKTMPPIVVGRERGEVLTIIDGAHRVRAALGLGAKTIPAWVAASRAEVRRLAKAESGAKSNAKSTTESAPKAKSKEKKPAGRKASVKKR